MGTVTPNIAPMTAITLDGEALAARIKDDLRDRVAALAPVLDAVERPR